MPRDKLKQKLNGRKLTGCRKSSSNKEVYSNTILPQEKFEINNLTSHLKQLEQEEQTKPKISRRKENVNIGVEINEIETKKTIAKINEAKCHFFVKIKKIDKPLAKLTNKIKGRRLKSIIRNEKEVATDSTEIPWIMRNYYEYLHANEMENLEDMGKFLEMCSLSRQEEIENMNIQFTST